MDHAAIQVSAGAQDPDLHFKLCEFNAAAVEIYKDLICDSERVISRHLFRAACRFSEYVSGVLHAEARRDRRLGALAGRRMAQECLYWLWLLDQKGFLSGHPRREQAFRSAFALVEGLTDVVAEEG